MKDSIKPDMKDTELWILLIKGNQQALEILYQRYYTLLFNWGIKYCADRELVKDCIQDLFIGLYRNANISIGAVTVRAYLLKALKNNLFYKQMSTQKEECLGGEWAFDIPVSEDWFDQMFSKSDDDMRLIHNLLEALNKLSSHQKSVLYLRYVKDLSYKEIAHIMDINVQSSMNLANRALTRLRELLEAKGFM